MRSLMLRATLALTLLAPSGADARYMGVYDYPFVSALVATVAGTPPANQAPMLPADQLAEVAETRYLEVFPERPVPPVFWFYGRGMPYAVLKQPGPAPLIFLIGGTGAGHDSAKSLILANVLYRAGYHVVSLASPTHTSFIVTASQEGVPGRLEADARDLYRVMGMIDDQLRAEIQVSGYYVAGYSLGGTHSAVVSYIDEREKRFNFTRAVVINPSVSLFNSVNLLDEMFDRHLDTDPVSVNRFVDRTFQQVIALSSVGGGMGGGGVDFADSSAIYRAYTILEPPERELELLIGLAFRLASNDMAFASDVMTDAGYVVPKNASLTPTTSLTDVLLQGLGLNFIDYFEGIYIPYYRQRFPDVTRDELIERASLRRIEPYLRAAERVVMLGTQDDVILAPGEVAWLQDVFGERARIFPTGGHCGSMDQREFVAAMLELMGR
jgi:Alpha/beta hydrolase family